MEKKRKLRDALEAHCGSKKSAIDRINKVKDQRENVNVEDEDDISIDDPDSVVGRLELYPTYILLYSTYVLLACLTKVRR